MVTAAAARTPPDFEQLLISRLDDDLVHVPPYPAIAFKLQQLTRSNYHNGRDICSVVGADPGLVATVLRRANSATYAGTNRIHVLEAAVMRIGLDELVQLSVAQSAGVTANRHGPLASLRREVWRSSLMSACLAVELAPRRGVSTEAAFIAGLLHDFGAIAVLASVEDLGVELPILPASGWKAIVDRLHVSFGVVLADRWNLPPDTRYAIAYHHTPASCPEVARAVVELVATVDDVLAIFDSFPDVGVDALVAVGGLSEDERGIVGRLVPQLVNYVSTFETKVISPSVRSAVQPRLRTIEGGRPAHFTVTSARHVFEAYAVGPSAFAFRGATGLPVNWIAPMVLECVPSIAMFANVVACEPLDAGGFAMVAQPFGLDGPDKTHWASLLRRTRRPTC